MLCSCTQQPASAPATTDHPLTVVVIGDSNGAADIGWVVQSQQLEPNWQIINRSIPGNTIGFDNLDNPKLNTLRQIDRYLSSAQADAKADIDYVIIALGTNDCKTVFADREAEVRDNLRTLIDRVRAFPFKQDCKPEIVIVSPPPCSGDERVIYKYKGTADRVTRLVPDFRTIASERGLLFIDIHAPLMNGYDRLTSDGVHLTAEGHEKVARILIDTLIQHATTHQHKQEK